MDKKQNQVTIELTPGQLSALEQLAGSENSNIASLVSRSVDTFIATYRAQSSIESKLEAKLDKFYDHTIKLLIALMKLTGQTLYFSQLPLTTGPLKARLNEKGIAVQWHSSEQFAADLLKPPQVKDNHRADMEP